MEKDIGEEVISRLRELIRILELKFGKKPDNEKLPVASCA